MRALRFLERPARFDYLDEYIRGRKVRLLDVGCGWHSPSLTKRYYPDCLYYGLDKRTDYHLSREDFEYLEAFYRCDLSEGNLDALPNDFFDCVVFSHVIEHIPNGEEVIAALVRKMKAGAIVYIEFPAERSAHLPSMPGTLNFYDDTSHVRLYTLEEVKSALAAAGCETIRCGTRRSLRRILLLPIYALGSLIKYRRLMGGVLWDVLGFASFALARKKARQL